MRTLLKWVTEGWPRSATPTITYRESRSRPCAIFRATPREFPQRTNHTGQNTQVVQRPGVCQSTLSVAFAFENSRNPSHVAFNKGDTSCRYQKRCKPRWLRNSVSPSLFEKFQYPVPGRDRC